MGLEGSLFWWRWRLSPTPVDNRAAVGKGFATCQTGLSLQDERFSTSFRICPRVFPHQPGGHPRFIHGLSTGLWQACQGLGGVRGVGVVDWVWTSPCHPSATGTGRLGSQGRGLALPRSESIFPRYEEPFAAVWSDREIVQRTVAQIPLRRNLVLLDNKAKACDCVAPSP